MASIKFLQDIEIDGEIFVGEQFVSRINMTYGSAATENKYKQTLGSNFLIFDLDPDQQQSNSNMQFRVDLSTKMNIGTSSIFMYENLTVDSSDVTVGNDLYVDGGKIYMGANTSPIFDNSATSSILLIGDTALNDSVETINLRTFGITQVQVGDGEIFFFGSIEAENSINVSQGGNLNIGDDSKITFQNDSKLQLDTNITTNNESNGITITTATSATTAGLIYALRVGSPIWASVNSNTDRATKLLAVATGTNATGGMLTMGVVRKASHGYTVGAPLYISSTQSGHLSNTAPTASGDYVRVCGYAIDANHYYFNPDGAWVQIV
jgi:hypothetical protein